MNRLSREQIARRVARDIPDGAYVNLGIGLPTTVANFLPADKEIFLHSENGVLGMGPAPPSGQEDPAVSIRAPVRARPHAGAERAGRCVVFQSARP